MSQEAKLCILGVQVLQRSSTIVEMYSEYAYATVSLSNLEHGTLLCSPALVVVIRHYWVLPTRGHLWLVLRRLYEILQYVLVPL